jgi:hypothetical protein
MSWLTVRESSCRLTAQEVHNRLGLIAIGIPDVTSFVRPIFAQPSVPLSVTSKASLPVFALGFKAESNALNVKVNVSRARALI